MFRTQILAALLLAAACANPSELEDAGPLDATVEPDAGVGSDAGFEDAGERHDAGDPHDGGTDADAGNADDAGVNPCTPTGRQYFMLGSAQNPQTIVFGAGLPNERSLDIDGAYLASFDSSGCFEWLAPIPGQQGSFGGPGMIVDANGNMYFGFTLNGDIEFRNSDDTVALTISSTATAPAERFRRGIIIVSYDSQGRLRWVRRMGNAGDEPASKGYSLASLVLTGGKLRVAGSANGSTNGPAVDYDVAFGLGEANETRVTIGQRFQFGFVAAISPDTGDLIADSVRITAPLIGATNMAARHNGVGSGREAADGSYALGQLYVGSAGNYVLNRGRVDELGFSVSANFVAGFAKYDGAGALAWHRFAGAVSGGMAVFSSGVLADGSVLFSGGAPDQADFAEGAGTVALAAGATAYLVRYDPTGDVAWLRGISGRGFARMLVDETRGAVFVIGGGTGDVTFGVGDADAVTASLAGIFVARFDLTTGALVWLSPVDSASASFRDIILLGNELLLTTRFDNVATFAPRTADELVIRSAPDIWSGTARYGADDGAFLGTIEYVRQRGTPLNDGLNVGGLYQP